MATLFDPVEIGSISCQNRIFMAPLTRARGTRDGLATPIMVDYYAQRASAGLIISEAIAVDRQGYGWLNTTGLWNEHQVDSWKPVVKAVHDRGGKIVAQLWHMGRMGYHTISGEPTVSCSPTTPPGFAHQATGKVPYDQAKELTIPEIKAIVKDFGLAARHAIEAGFDGVQIHGANGYLIDQFLRDSTNLRKDEYGGSPENRIRFLREVTESVIAAIGKERTGVRLSPNGEIQGCVDSDPAKVFIPAAAMLQELGVAWIGLREARPGDTFDMAPPTDQPPLSPEIRKVFHGKLVLNGDYTLEEAEKAVQGGAADAISWGRLWITNPDLVARFKNHLKLETAQEPTIWYAAYTTDKARGYTDYPLADGKPAQPQP
ncbi:alkene reductase [Formicincola oecophyllae]|uniref:Alkene reductase n=1 Tax=Formicincola oecophyllae TaxID=2558361 RepID=A0A4Y6U766_9PROT|nr:alkene reductase [Formicincola oecophyllae]QDH12870.1 alkene reductase [Formicincola oecophyllae]